MLILLITVLYCTGVHTFDDNIPTDQPLTTKAGDDLGKRTLSYDGALRRLIEQMTEPFSAAVITSYKKCGGSIVGTQKVLTALHCVMDNMLDNILGAQSISVYIQSTRYNVINVIPYDSWEFKNTYDGDLCVLELQEVLNLDTGPLKKILLASEANVDRSAYDDQSYAQTYAMYLVGSDSLVSQYVKFTQWSYTCKKSVNLEMQKNIIRKGMVCTVPMLGSNDQLYRHLSGSPLYIQQGDTYIQLAVASFRPSREDYVGKDVHANLLSDKFKDWLKRVIRDPEGCVDEHENCRLQWADLCNREGHKVYMHQNCKKTCNLCIVEPPINPGCVDEHENCRLQWADLCNREEHKAYMHQSCRKTCNLCIVKPLINPEYKNIAKIDGYHAIQSDTKRDYGTDRPAELALDNNFSTYTHTEGQRNTWWKLTLPRIMYIHQVILFNRRRCCYRRLNGARVTVDGVLIGTVNVEEGEANEVKNPHDGYKFNADRRGKEIKVSNNDWLHLAEVQVLGKEIN